jgi:uncharacterized protein YhbP (UPF0306 family)
MDDLEKIKRFLSKHHVMALATIGEKVSSCSAFYAYDIEDVGLIFASSEDTLHMQNISQNPQVAGSIHLETKEIGKIQGLQFEGECLEADDTHATIYFRAFPHAKVMKPKLWYIQLNFLKLTDNRLGFGKKIRWQRV